MESSRFWQDWLNDSGSLTQKIEKAIGQKLVVKVLRDRRQSLHPDEYHYFQNRIKHCRVREVLLCANETPLVIARSIIPTLSSSGSNHSILRLGTKPLGAVLFSKTRMHSKTRPQRDVARIDSASHPLSPQGPPHLSQRSFSASFTEILCNLIA
jgi:chorismate--pyruvate lyase